MIMDNRNSARGFDRFATLLIVLIASGLVLAQTRQPGRRSEKASGESLVVVGKTSSRAGTFVGESRPLGNGTVRSWVTLDRNGDPTAVGVTFSEAALSGLPAKEPGTKY